MFSVIQTVRKKDLPTHVILYLFDKIVVPVLLYGCEVLGYDNFDLVKVWVFENLDLYVVDYL